LLAQTLMRDLWSVMESFCLPVLLLSCYRTWLWSSAEVLETSSCHLLLLVGRYCSSVTYHDFLANSCTVCRYHQTLTRDEFGCWMRCL
jgi:hypothetical protein